MTLIVLLCAMILDFVLAGIDRFRHFVYLTKAYQKMNTYCSGYKYYYESVGLVVFLSVLIFLVWLLACFIAKWHPQFEILLQLIILMICFAPGAVHRDRLKFGDLVQKNSASDDPILSSIKERLSQGHQDIFAVIFWFVVLGVLGALLYRIVVALDSNFNSGGNVSSPSIRTLLKILEWPSSWLAAISFALAGNMKGAIYAFWQRKGSCPFSMNNDIFHEVGVKSLSYPNIDSPEETNKENYWAESVAWCLNTALVIWIIAVAVLVVLGDI